MLNAVEHLASAAREKTRAELVELITLLLERVEHLGAWKARYFCRSRFKEKIVHIWLKVVRWARALNGRRCSLTVECLISQSIQRPNELLKTIKHWVIKSIQIHSHSQPMSSSTSLHLWSPCEHEWLVSNNRAQTATPLWVLIQKPSFLPCL